MLDTLKKGVVDFLRSEDGPTAVEYAVMLAFIIVVCVAAVGTIGTSTSSVYNNAQLKTALGGSS